MVSSSKEKGQIWQQFLGGSQEEQPKTYREASPLAHLDAGDPPILIIAGEQDDPSTRAELFVKTATELGVSTDSWIVDDGGHNYFREPDVFDETIRRAAAFFRENLK
jgi:pectinesterase